MGCVSPGASQPIFYINIMLLSYKTEIKVSRQ